jgi:hypothetical protein
MIGRDFRHMLTQARGLLLLRELVAAAPPVEDERNLAFCAHAAFFVSLSGVSVIEGAIDAGPGEGLTFDELAPSERLAWIRVVRVVHYLEKGLPADEPEN